MMKKFLNSIHPSAIISPTAKIHSTATVGPFSVIGDGVRLGKGVEIGSHVVIESGNTEIEDGVQIFPFSVIGTIPQDKKFNAEIESEFSKLRIGRGSIIREHVSIHSGSRRGGNITRIGSKCLIMAGVHIGHDCSLGDSVVIANSSALAGHVRIDDGAIIGGLCGIKQRVRIGKGCMIGGSSAVDKDVVPYSLVLGNRANLAGLNLIGLKRRGLPSNEILPMLNVFRYIFGGSTMISTLSLSKFFPSILVNDNDNDNDNNNSSDIATRSSTIQDLILTSNHNLPNTSSNYLLEITSFILGHETQTPLTYNNISVEEYPTVKPFDTIRPLTTF